MDRVTRLPDFSKETPVSKCSGPELPISSPCGYLSLYFGNDLANAMIDSGSSLSFVDMSLKDDFVKNNFEYVQHKYRIRVADRRWVVCAGYIRAKFKIRQRSFQFPLILMEECLHPIILGADFLSFSGLTPNFKENFWYWSDKPRQCYKLRRSPVIPTNAAMKGELNEFSASIQDIDVKVNEIEILDENQKKELLEVLLRRRSIFSSKVGKVDYTMDIETTDSIPVALKPYHLSRLREMQVESHVHNMAAQGLIVKGSSDYAAPCFITPKKGGETRLVISYVELNKKIKADAFPTPNIIDLLTRVPAPKFKSSLDCLWAFWHVPMTESAGQKAAFVTHKDLWIPKVCMFGLKTSPAHFCRAITEIVEPLNKLGLRAFFDDLSLLNTTWEQHLHALDNSLGTLNESGIRLNLKKTEFCKTELLILGYLLTDSGLKPNPNKQKILLNWPLPKTVKEVRQFLGISGWFRKFLLNYAKKAAPLYDILKGAKPTFFWGPEQDLAFNVLKSDLMKAPILAPPDLTKPWIVFSDASGLGLGSILTQHNSEGKLVTVDMVSRRFSKAEMNYTVNERELLAIVWSLKQWKHLLEGSSVTVVTDHRPLVVLKKLKNPTGRTARWLVFLSSLDARLVFNPGRLNVAADSLSRMFDEGEIQPANNPVLEPIPNKTGENQSFLFNNNYFVASTCDVEQLTIGKIAIETAKDEFTSALYKTLKGEIVNNLPPAVLRFVKTYAPKSVIDDDQSIVYVNVAKSVLKTDYKILIPKSLQREVINLCHSLPSSGHLGARRCIKSVFRLYTWRGAAKMISRFVAQCRLCQIHKAQTSRTRARVSAAPLRFPGYELAIDHLGPYPRSPRGNRFLLTVLDTFSGWLQAYPLRSASEKLVVNSLLDYFSRFGICHVIRSDNGSALIGKTIREVYRRFRIKPSVTCLAHPVSNRVERLTAIYVLESQLLFLRNLIIVIGISILTNFV